MCVPMFEAICRVALCNDAQPRPLSAEATINFTYFQQTKTQTYRSYDNATQVYSSQNVPLSTSGVKLTVNPVYIMNVGYYF